MSALQVHQFPCLGDNYGYLVHDPDSGLTASIDSPDAKAITRALAERGWILDYILNPSKMQHLASRPSVTKLKR